MSTPAGPPQRRRAAVLTAILGCALFAGLLALVESGWGPLHRLDHAMARHLNGFVSERHLTTLFWKAVTDAGAPFVWNTLATVAVIVLAVRRVLRPAAFVAATMIGSTAIDNAVKSLVARPRPVVPVPISHARGFSFPSGHAMTSLVAVGVLLTLVVPLLPRARARARAVALAIGVVVIGAIGVSRLMLGVHYVSDVVGGWLLGAAWLTLMIAVFSPTPMGSSRPPHRSAVHA